MKTRWEKTVNKDYLGSYSLDNGEGQYINLIAVIESVQIGEVKNDRGTERVTIAHIKGQKPMILNKTNMKTLTRLFKSPYIEDWANKKILIEVKKVRAFGEVHDALRISNKHPELPVLDPNSDKWPSALKSIQEGNTTIDQIKKYYRLSPQNEQLLCSK